MWLTLVWDITFGLLTQSRIKHGLNRTGIVADSLDKACCAPGVTRVVTREQGIFKYFLKVVPTTFKRGFGRPVQSNQFSVTEYDAAQPGGSMQLPAVWFLYDLSPISVDIVESHPSLLHFLTRICAVVGGGFTVTGALGRPEARAGL